jgi:hypothetical protein
MNPDKYVLYVWPDQWDLPSMDSDCLIGTFDFLNLNYSLFCKHI